MQRLTKIFHFEIAHALHRYSGACKNIQGHSYELHVPVCSANGYKDNVPPPGFILDFKELKTLVLSTVIEKFGRRLALSHDYQAKNPDIHSQEYLVILEAESMAENLLIYIKRILKAKIPLTVKLAELKLYETKDSYATWINNNTES